VVDWKRRGRAEADEEADKFVGGLEDLVKKSKTFTTSFRTAKELLRRK
jgi:hypothetical protein